MTSKVQKLADEPCPDCKGTGGWPLDERREILESCPTCQGSGALVLGLRRKCPGGEDERDLTVRRVDHELGRCECQGRGWVLIPDAEVMGVLVRAAKSGVIRLYEGNGWGATVGAKGQGYKPADTPEDALAIAILQAKGIE